MTLILNQDGTISETTEVRRGVKQYRDEIRQLKAIIDQMDIERAKLVARRAELKALVDSILE